MLYLGADHAGYSTKEVIRRFLDKNNIQYKDFSSKYVKEDDYPDYAKQVAKAVAKDKNAKGVLICGTGTGMAMAANRVKGVRAAFVYDIYSAIKAREDNDANIITLRGKYFSKLSAKALVKIFLDTPFSKLPRHKRRIKKL
ncbi:MAG: RpiB/LacA/LacB family sugar-phosphate isomerase [Candidatus Woesearchaeota archaeon]